MASTEHVPHTSESATALETELRPTGGPRRTLPLLLAVTLIVIALIGAAVWYVQRDNGTSTTKHSPAAAASTRALASLAGAVGHPVYWAGAKSGYTYELTHTTDGRIYIRYLPAGVPVGTAKPNYLTVGTYPVKDALGTVTAIGHKSGGTVLKLANGGVGAVDPAHPLSVYIAYPGSAYEVEVYDPTTGAAQRLVSGGAIVPAGTNAPSVPPIAATAATPAQIHAVAASSGHPVYWAGAQTGRTYELSRLSDGRIYVRYLPAGVNVGAQQPFLTVASYPVQDAFSAVTAIGRRSGATQIALPGGGIAVTDPAHPTSVYIAYPKANVQVEVFAPAAGRAEMLVKRGEIVPVP